MNNLISISGKQLIINRNYVDFEGEIQDILVMDYQVIVLYRDRTKPLIDNICSVDYDGNFRWRIQHITDFNKKLTSCTYVGLFIREDGSFQINDFWGRRFFFDPETGKILKRDTTGRDW